MDKLFSQYSSSILFNTRASTVPFLGTYPNYNLSISTVSRNLFSTTGTLLVIFTTSSSNLISLYNPQYITSPFPLSIETTTLVFHSYGIHFPSRKYPGIALTSFKYLLSFLPTSTKSIYVLFPLDLYVIFLFSFFFNQVFATHNSFLLQNFSNISSSTFLLPNPFPP